MFALSKGFRSLTILPLETGIEYFKHCTLVRFQRMFTPGFTIFTAQNDDLSLLLTQRGKVGHFNDDWPANAQAKGNGIRLIFNHSGSH